jgi:hypothetical protein
MKSYFPALNVVQTGSEPRQLEEHSERLNTDSAMHQLLAQPIISIGRDNSVGLSCPFTKFTFSLLDGGFTSKLHLLAVKGGQQQGALSICAKNV